MPLDRNNRVLVAAGLRRINAGQASAGVQALIQVGGRDAARVDATDLGFVVGPRINAAGRLEDMRVGILCLIADSHSEALQHATALDRINRERRSLQTQMVDEAESWLARHHGEARDLPAVMCLFDESWHAGVIGLVASRIKDKVHRPVFAFAPAAEGSAELKGSARSIAGVHIRDLLAELDASRPGLIHRFGGHAMAAGLSLDRQRLEEFQSGLLEVVTRRVDPALLQACVLSDGAIAAADIDLALVEAIRSGGPWGQAFPEPVFDGAFEIESTRVMAERHLGLRLRCVDSGRAFDAVHFGAYSGTSPRGRWHYVFQPFVDEWRGERRLRLMIRHALPIASVAASAG